MNHLDRSKFRGEMWTKKFKPIEPQWQTCNREYGDFTPRNGVVEMEPEIEIDEGPVLASTYQVGYSTKPDERHKWMDSWKGYVKRKKPAKTAPYRSLKNVPRAPAPKSHAGVKLPPIDGQKSAAQRDIMIKDGAIYMPTPRNKRGYCGVNEKFFNFKYSDIWMPLNFR